MRKLLLVTAAFIAFTLHAYADSAECFTDMQALSAGDKIRQPIFDIAMAAKAAILENIHNNPDSVIVPTEYVLTWKTAMSREIDVESERATAVDKYKIDGCVSADASPSYERAVKAQSTTLRTLIALNHLVTGYGDEFPANFFVKQ
jgi:hypothetical protein